MTNPTETAQLSKKMLWTGGIVTGLAVAFLAVDALAKIAEAPAVVAASRNLGLPLQTTAGIGVVLLVCTAIYAFPRTAVLGALLLTAYLGGAVAIHVRAGSGLFAVVFSIVFGVLVWVGLVLREPRLFRTILLRR